MPCQVSDPETKFSLLPNLYIYGTIHWKNFNFLNLQMAKVSQKQNMLNPQFYIKIILINYHLLST